LEILRKKKDLLVQGSISRLNTKIGKTIGLDFRKKSVQDSLLPAGQCIIAHNLNRRKLPAPIILKERKHYLASDKCDDLVNNTKSREKKEPYVDLKAINKQRQFGFLRKSPCKYNASATKKDKSDILTEVIKKREEEYKSLSKFKVKPIVIGRNKSLTKESIGVINSIPRHDLTKEFKKLFQNRTKNFLGNNNSLGPYNKNPVDFNRIDNLLPPLNFHDYSKGFKSTLAEHYKS